MHYSLYEDRKKESKNLFECVQRTIETAASSKFDCFPVASSVHSRWSCPVPEVSPPPDDNAECSSSDYQSLPAALLVSPKIR